jgi:hypothetical protein
VVVVAEATGHIFPYRPAAVVVVVTESKILK